jgi:hypothetical protein
MDEPPDPFELQLPRELGEQLREQLSEEAAAAFERFTAEFARAGVDYRALLGQPSYRATVYASLALAADTDRIRLAAILAQAAARARLADDPDAFGDWLAG